MKTFRYPKRNAWPEIIRRAPVDMSLLEASVRQIIAAVKRDGDQALRDFLMKFDKVKIDELAVTESEIAAAQDRVPNDLKAAIAIAKANVETFHRSQHEIGLPIETTPGIFCWRRSVAIDKVGLYVPAGSAPLFSTVLMLGIPAKLAGCREIVLCSPPNALGRVDDTILYTARLCGITKIFRTGGAQAIAAMAYGTETVPRVDKIFGPGNSFVTSAKQIVSTEVAIDMPAGPSEVAVLADESCNPAFVAADLLAQAEHGADSQVILVTTSVRVLEKTLDEIKRQIVGLPRRGTVEAALKNSAAVIVTDLAEGLELLNEYAPEHLILAVENADDMAGRVVNAGSVFIGNYSCESAGDYASGTNHTLPTAGFARAYSGVSLDSFVKKITFQRISPEGICNLGASIEVMAQAEGLEAHKRAVSVRLEEINGL